MSTNTRSNHDILIALEDTERDVRCVVPKRTVRLKEHRMVLVKLFLGNYYLVGLRVQLVILLNLMAQFVERLPWLGVFSLLEKLALIFQ